MLAGKVPVEAYNDWACYRFQGTALKHDHFSHFCFQLGPHKTIAAVGAVMLIELGKATNNS